MKQVVIATKNKGKAKDFEALQPGQGDVYAEATAAERRRTGSATGSTAGPARATGPAAATAAEAATTGATGGTATGRAEG